MAWFYKKICIFLFFQKKWNRKQFLKVTIAVSSAEEGIGVEESEMPFPTCCSRLSKEPFKWLRKVILTLKNIFWFPRVLWSPFQRQWFHKLKSHFMKLSFRKGIITWKGFGFTTSSHYPLKEEHYYNKDKIKFFFV